eukprot:jgi/Botrbrau1/12959/Bobra.154_2s0018.2
MGIPGLLPALRSITTTVHITAYSGHKVAVDAYSWLHKGAYSCSKELCEGEAPDKCVNYCMQRVELLRSSGVLPIVVFDGGRLPMKNEEESARKRSREGHLEKARAHMAAGNAAAAYDCYQKAVDISPRLAKEFIEALKLAEVEFIVAPYEADAQMAFFALNGHVHAVITEDSDLLAYGCPRVLYKMDRSGEGQQICREDFSKSKGLSLVGFTDDMFLEMCILVGCDFVKALPGVGIKKAHEYIRKLKTFSRVIKSLRFSGISVPRDYEERFQRAIWTFRHQRVFCPQRETLKHLRDIPASGLWLSGQPLCESLDFLGPPLPNEVAKAVAMGEIDPLTQRPFQDLPPRVLQPKTLNTIATQSDKQTFHKHKGSERRSGHKHLLPVQSNTISSYFQSASSRQDGPTGSGRTQHVRGTRQDENSPASARQAETRPASGMSGVCMSLSASVYTCRGGSDISTPAIDDGVNEESTASQADAKRPARVSGGSIFSRFRMCPVAEAGSAAASVQSTPSEPQASCEPPFSHQETLSQDLVHTRNENCGPREPPPSPDTFSYNSLAVRSSNAFQTDHNIMLSPTPHGNCGQQTLDSKRSTSDLLRFSMSPPSAKRQKQTHPGLLDHQLPLAGFNTNGNGLLCIPDTPSSPCGNVASEQPLENCHFPDSEEQQQIQLDHLFARQSCSMELASCRTVTTALLDEEKATDTAINTLFGLHSSCDPVHVRDAGCEGTYIDRFNWPEPQSIFPVACHSPEVNPMSRTARRGLNVPHLLAQCSNSPISMVSASPASAFQRRGTKAREPACGCDQIFAPLGQGLQSHYQKKELAVLDPHARPQTQIETSLAHQEDSVGQGVGPLEGGSKRLARVRTSQGFRRPISKGPMLKQKTPASPGPLEEGLGPLYRGSKPIGPLQHAVKANSKRRKVQNETTSFDFLNQTAFSEKEINGLDGNDSVVKFSEATVIGTKALSSADENMHRSDTGKRKFSAFDIEEPQKRVAIGMALTGDATPNRSRGPCSIAESPDATINNGAEVPKLITLKSQNPIHSLEHMPHFQKEAKAALDRVQATTGRQASFPMESSEKQLLSNIESFQNMRYANFIWSLQRTNNFPPVRNSLQVNVLLICIPKKCSRMYL